MSTDIYWVSFQKMKFKNLIPENKNTKRAENQPLLYL